MHHVISGQELSKFKFLPLREAKSFRGARAAKDVETCYSFFVTGIVASY